ncbi:MAG: hypothetical protein ACXVBC_12885, partial [Bdellovibrionota bacterium]
SNSAGQLGTEEIPTTGPGNFSAQPMLVGALNSILALDGGGKQLIAGGNTSCVITAKNNVYCWGDNTQLEMGSIAATPVSGNKVRAICGTSVAGVTGPGFCKGFTSGTIFSIAGQSGNTQSVTTGIGAQASSFARLQGISYDGSKNILVTSSGYADGLTAVGDFGIFSINGAATSPLQKLSFSFTDSNSNTSNYCLRAKIVTSCNSQGACSCGLTAPFDSTSQNFWVPIPLTPTLPASGPCSLTDQ